MFSYKSYIKGILSLESADIYLHMSLQSIQEEICPSSLRATGPVPFPGLYQFSISNKQVPPGDRSMSPLVQ